MMNSDPDGGSTAIPPHTSAVRFLIKHDGVIAYQDSMNWFTKFYFIRSLKLA